MDFEEELSRIIGRPSSQRPFVCNGHPGSCPVWVVGHNAATPGGDWWQHWKTGTGFDKGSWLSSYLEDRVARGKGPSATRRRLDRISAAVPGVLETNIYSAPSSAMSNMPSSTTEAFDFLLKTFAPRVIVAHGVEAQRHLSGWTGGRLFAIRHLSRASYGEVDDIIMKLGALSA